MYRITSQPHVYMHAHLCYHYISKNFQLVIPSMLCPFHVSPGGGDLSAAPCGTAPRGGATAGRTRADRGGGGVEIQQTLGLGKHMIVMIIGY